MSVLVNSDFLLQSFEDLQLVNRRLPTLMALEWPEIPSHDVGSLLSFGHFIEMISTKDLPEGTQKALFNYRKFVFSKIFSAYIDVS